MDNVLDEIGLTSSEIKVYSALLELGDSTRGDIVNKSKIAGSKVYEILEKLQEKGLVSIYIKNKVKHFKPTNPKQILNYLGEKKEKIRRVETDVNKILPSLLQLYNSSKEDREVELLTGLKGLQIIFREQVDMLEKGETCYVIGGTVGTGEGAVTAFFEKVHVMRQDKGIKTKLLYNERQKESTKKTFSQYKNAEFKYIKHTSPVAMNIWKDRTAILIFGKEITAIYIKSQDVADSYKEYFNLLWNS